MKKAMILMLAMWAGTALYSQGYTFEDPDFAKAAAKVQKLEQVKVFPWFFYFDVEDSNMPADNRNLFYLTKKQYDKYPDSFNAVYNYGAALMSELKMDGYIFLPQRNAYEARKVLQKAIKLNPQSVESYFLLDQAYEHIIFRDMRVNAFLPQTPFYEDVAGESVRTYRANQERTRERLAVFEKRVALQDEFISYLDGAWMCEALGLQQKAQQYRTRAEQSSIETLQKAQVEELKRQLQETESAIKALTKVFKGK